MKKNIKVTTTNYNPVTDIGVEIALIKPFTDHNLFVYHILSIPMGFRDKRNFDIDIPVLILGIQSHYIAHERKSFHGLLDFLNVSHGIEPSVRK